MGVLLAGERENYWREKLLEEVYDFHSKVRMLSYYVLSLGELQYKIKNKEPKDAMRKDLLEQYEKELIHDISLQANGVGKNKAGAVAEYFGSIQDFLKADKTILQKIVNASGKSILNAEAIDSLLSIKGEIIKGQPITET